MVKKETYIFTSVISVLVILAFSLLYFLIPFPVKDSTSHAVNYALTVVVGLVFVISFLFGLQRRKEIEGLVFRLPLLKLTITFEILNLVFSIAQVVINAFVVLPFYSPIIVALFEVIIFFILLMLKKQNVNHIENSEEILKSSTHNIKELRTKSINILSLCKDDVSKENVSKVVDKLKYSDPVSSASTKDLEDEIYKALAEIEQNLKDGKAINSTSNILVLIDNRNTVCLENKD